MESGVAAPSVVVEPWSEHPPTLPPPIEIERGPLPAWGAWATLGWLLLAALATVIAQLGVGVVLGIVGAVYFGAMGQPVGPGTERLFEESYGLMVAIIGLATAGATIGFLYLPISLRRRGFGEYLGLIGFSARAAWAALAAVTLLVLVEMVLGFVLERPMPEEMVLWRKTAVFVPLLYLYVIAVGPVVEELVFRGFVYRGLAESRLRPMGAIAISSLLWTAVHIQYGLYELSWIFVMGLLLGGVRWRTGSTWLCVLGHGVLNLVATVVLEWWWVVEGAAAS